MPKAKIIDADRCLFLLEPEEFKAFEQTLANAPKANEILKELRKRSTLWNPSARGSSVN